MDTPSDNAVATVMNYGLRSIIRNMDNENKHYWYLK